MKNALASKYAKQLEKSFIDPIVEEAVKERLHNLLETEKHYKARLKHSIKDGLHKFQHRLKSAVKALNHHHAWPDKERFAKTIDLLEHQENFAKELEKGHLIQEVIGFTNDEMHHFYEVGYQAFSRKAYEEAGNIFLFLTQLNPTISAFWSALGAAEEGCGEIADAAKAYIFAAELDDHTIASYLQAAKCYLILHQLDEAKKILERSLERADETHSPHELKERAQKMLNDIG